MPPEDRPEPTRLRRKLAEELANLRSRAGLGMRPFADLVYPRDPMERPASQRVQRVENAYLLPTLEEIDRWLDATEATPDERDRVMTAAGYAHAENSTWMDLLAEMGGRHLNALAEGDERSAKLNCSYQQFIVPGLGQTADYARALVPHLAVSVDIDDHIEGLQDRQTILMRDDRQFQWVLTMRAWQWNPDPNQPALMDEQHAKLREIDERPNVSIRVLADDAPPMGGYSSFTLYDDRRNKLPALAVIELDHNRVKVLGDDVDRYRARFADLYAAATPIGDAP